MGLAGLVEHLVLLLPPLPHLRLLLGCHVVHLGVERHLDMCLGIRCVAVDDNDVDLLEVLEQSMKVVEMDPATVIIPTKLALAVEDAECVQD